jgi:hypothetical protein
MDKKMNNDEYLEELDDIAAIDEALSSNEPMIPPEEVKAELGL